MYLFKNLVKKHVKLCLALSNLEHRVITQMIKLRK